MGEKPFRVDAHPDTSVVFDLLSKCLWQVEPQRHQTHPDDDSGIGNLLPVPNARARFPNEFNGLRNEHLEGAGNRSRNRLPNVGDGRFSFRVLLSGSTHDRHRAGKHRRSAVNDL